MFRYFLGVSIVFLLFSCSSDSGTNPDGIQPTYSDISTQIFDKRCSCHLSTPNSTPVVLASDQAYANIVSQPSTQKPQLLRINPGNPDLSYLYLKITKSTGDPDISGNRMPRNGPPYLSDEEIDVIRQWIADGAKNN